MSISFRKKICQKKIIFFHWPVNSAGIPMTCFVLNQSAGGKRNPHEVFWKSSWKHEDEPPRCYRLRLWKPFIIISFGWGTPGAAPASAIPTGQHKAEEMQLCPHTELSLHAYKVHTKTILTQSRGVMLIGCCFKIMAMGQSSSRQWTRFPPLFSWLGDTIFFSRWYMGSLF